MDNLKKIRMLLTTAVVLGGAILGAQTAFASSEVLHIGEVSFVPAQGLLGSSVFGSSSTDLMLASPAGTGDSIFSITNERMFGQAGIAKYEIDQEKQSVHLTMQEVVYWHDGTELTLDDLVFAYEVIAHPDYTGARFSEAVQAVKGIMAYYEGTADDISGMVLSADKRELTIFFDTLEPAYFFMSGGMWTVPMPRHHFEGVAVEDMPASLQMREDIVGFGPYVVDFIVPGELVAYKRNDNYVFGTPKIEALDIQVVLGEVAPLAFEVGGIDIVHFSADWFETYDDMPHAQIFGEVAPIYNHLTFRLGQWDEKSGRNVTDGTKRTSDVRLRQAMAYAIDQSLITDYVFSGRRVPATSVVPPAFGAFFDADLAGFGYDVARANVLLDEAGYVDITADGYRESPDGQPLTLILAIHEAGPNEMIARFLIEQWAKVGLHVALHEDRMAEFSDLMAAVLSDDPSVDEVDLVWGSWLLSNPMQQAIWGVDSRNNFSRFGSDALEEIMTKMTSTEALEMDVLKATVGDFQVWFNDNVPAIINNWQMDNWAVNDRVTGFSLGGEQRGLSVPFQWQLLELVSE